ncbi:MAG TPA: VOC family protein [Vicinamibacterales bacterium]|nr:VOC family protein [Vicinamibacterales bacterium]
MITAKLGVLGYDSFHFVVDDLDRSRRFYIDKLGFMEVARAGDKLALDTGQQALVFGAGDVRVCVSTPLAQRSHAARYLRRHPAGVMSLSLRVECLDQAIAFLQERGGTFVSDPVEDTDAVGGLYRAVEIATPLGDVTFRLVERNGYGAFAPGFVDSGVGNAERFENVFGIQVIDHVTSNGLTMQPIVSFYREVLGFQPFWEIAFHTQDVARAFAHGSGLKSIVMWDPSSQVKFATNEPFKPHFRDSQIYRFIEDNQGAGVQHVAFNVTDIVRTVEELARRGVEFMETPREYFRDLPRRLASLGIHNVKEELSLLEKHQILLDGSHDRYMLQIFMREAKALYSDERAGPFFYEIIQRCGDQGFGYGNFRALFESIERVQHDGEQTP